MASPAFLVNSIIAVEQIVADFLTDNNFGPTEAQSLIQTIEGLRGGIQALPVTAFVKDDLLNRLNSIQALLNAFISNFSGLTGFEVLTAVLALLTLLKQKIQALNLKPCRGKLSVCFPCVFSTNNVCR
ncbi:MAG: hypothetical protein ACM3ZC_01665 [Bacteroidota bacterium]